MAAQERYALQNRSTEWSYTSTRPYDDPFNEVELEVVFTLPSGTEHRMPAFWAGGSTWRVRYAPPAPGVYSYRTECNNAGDAGLHDRAGKLTVKPFAGQNPLLQRGFPRVAQDHRHFEHTDGAPFFWLGDTWWMGLCQRLDWPGGFQSLVADRSRKGFTVVQIVAGLYPDMPPNDARGANEAGFPWEADYSKINPAYFDMAEFGIKSQIMALHRRLLGASRRRRAGKREQHRRTRSWLGAIRDLVRQEAAAHLQDERRWGKRRNTVGPSPS
jgi:hypothetical protein